jgi:hypothetical protein
MCFWNLWELLKDTSWRVPELELLAAVGSTSYFAIAAEKGTRK